MAKRNSLVPDSIQKVVPCWDPVMKKYQNCAQQITSPITTGGGGPKGDPPVQRICVPPACCVDYNFFTELAECITSTNTVWLDPGSSFGACAPTCNAVLGGGMTFTQLWRAFIVSTCTAGWNILADGSIYKEVSDVTLSCYKTGTTLTNEGATIPASGLPQCIELIPQSVDCPPMQICWLLKSVCRGGQCFRYIDNIRYCTEAFPTILTSAQFNNCTNCQGTSPVVPVPPCNIEPIGSSLLGMSFNFGVGQLSFLSAIEFNMPVCCTDWTVVLSLLTPNLTFVPQPTLASGTTTGSNSIPFQIDIAPGTPIGVYITNIKAFVTCLGSPTILINIPLRVTLA